MLFRSGMQVAACLFAATALATPLIAQEQGAPVVRAVDTQGTPEERAATMLAQMTQQEKLSLLMGYFGNDYPATRYEVIDGARMGSAGMVPGIERLGIPPQWQADAGIGVATQGLSEEKRARTALPSGLAIAASWDREIAFAGGAMIGSEARSDGFNVMLGGSVNLLREPRNGRNFEYGGEDPLLAGTIVGQAIAGVQSNHIIDTTKHYAVNDQETDRNSGNSVIAEDALRMSDLLAFQFAIEGGDPGAVMCAYNKVNGTHACEHPMLLTQVLRDEWGWPGYVLSDWGGVHSTAVAANAGLDQESGYGLQMQGWFAADKLEAALASGELSQERIDLMVTRILRSMFAHGLIDHPVSEGQPIDFTAHRAISQAAAEAGIVLLKNEGDILPLAANARRIAVIGGHADKGVLSGGGSAQVYTEGVNAVPGIEPTSWPGPVVYYPSSPLEELRKLLPQAQIDYVDGRDHEEAARVAHGADIAIVFGTQWASESIDVPLHVEDDTLIETVALANRNTVVVLETGGPVLMPWADQVSAILEAWYPGRMGGAAIARVLTGAVNPSGHLPATFPASLDQLPHPEEPHRGDVIYTEGASVGYKWFDREGPEPLFPFGHGLSYTDFAYAHPQVESTEQGIVFSLTITNIGKRKGADVVQVYAEGEGWEAPQRLAGFARLELAPGETRDVDILVDPRLLAIWDTVNPGWSRKAGTYRFTAGHSSRVKFGWASIDLPASHLPPQWRPR